MNVAFTTIKTNDLVNSLKFYKEIIGLDEVRKIVPQEGIQCVFLKDYENTVIELVENKKQLISNFETERSQVSIGFSVDNLEDTLELLKKNEIQIINGPIETPSGEKFLFIKDPNGVEIELIQGFHI